MAEEVLSCVGICSEVFSFVDDDLLLDLFIAYLKISKTIQSQLLGGGIFCALNGRNLKCWCKSNLQFLLDNLPYYIKIKGLDISYISNLDSKMYTKTLKLLSSCEELQLRCLKLEPKFLMELLSLCKIKHLIFTNCDSLPLDYLTRKKIKNARISPTLSQISFRNNPYNPFKHLEFDLSFIEHCIFSGFFNYDDCSFLKRCYNIKRVDIIEQEALNSEIFSVMPIIDSLYLDSLVTSNIKTENLHVKIGEEFIPFSFPNNYVKTITFGGFSGNKLVGGFIIWLQALCERYPNCNEITLSDYFFDLVNQMDIDTIYNNTNTFNFKVTKLIIKKRSISVFSEIFKFIIQKLLPKTEIILEEANQNHYFKELSYNSDPTLILKETIWNKMKSLEKSVSLQSLYDTFDDIKLEYLRAIFLKSNDSLLDIYYRLNNIEGFKSNKEVMLKKLECSCSTYFDLFGEETGLEESVAHYFKEANDALSRFDDECFSNSYSILENILKMMVTHVKEAGYPTKILFNDQWISENMVEVYNSEDYYFL